MYGKTDFPSSLATGSDHSKSQYNPDFGGSQNLSIFFMSSRDYRSGDIPPWRARNLAFIIQANGSKSNESIKIS